MGWTATDRATRYGVVIYNYNKETSQQHRLQLSVGDTVNLLRQNEGWFYGFSTRDRHKKGIFPKSYVHIKEVKDVSSISASEVVQPKESPLAQEITTVLREWGPIWKQTYTTVHTGASEESVFEQVQQMMIDLINWRKQVMSRKLTVDEMKELQQRTTNKIDMGNALLGLDLVVRDERGNMLDPGTTSTISLFRQAQCAITSFWEQGIKLKRYKHLKNHELATQRIADERDQAHHTVSLWKSSSFSLWVNVVNFVCHIGENADALLSLYDAKLNQFISESYLTKWGSQGMPRESSLELPHNLNVLFTDLGLRDVQREKIFLVCHIVRIGRMSSKIDNKKHGGSFRRPFGVAVLDVTDVIKGLQDADETKQFFMPYMACNDKENMDAVMRKAVLAKEITQKEHRGQGLWITMKKMQGDVKQGRKENAHLVTNMTACARKMGFPDVIMPGDLRNDIYVTIAQGEFRRGAKTSDKNVEVSMCVCNDKGEVLKDVIIEGAGSSGISVYKSVIYYQCDKPRWFETVKVAVPIEACYGAHLKFSFKHRSSSDTKDRVEKPFAVAFVKILQDNGTTLSDSTHDLMVYKLDGKKPEDNTSYLRLYATKKEYERKNPGVNTPLSKIYMHAGPYVLNASDSFQISTLVCSTKLTHNEDLMGLLKWRENPQSLKANLTALMKVDGEEVVKFLQDILDALFNILMENSDCDNYDNLVFDALIYLIGLISDRKYHQFRPVLDVYIEENFSATLAYNKLMVALKYYIENVNENVQKESLLKAMKSLEYIFKFIIKSRILFAALNEGRGQQQFEQSLRQVFKTINKMMMNTDDSLVLIQGAALKYLPATIGDVITAFNPLEFSRMLVEFINNVPKNRLTKQKMLCLNDVVHSPLFLRSECRSVLLPVFLVQIKQLLENKEEMETCISILSNIMELLFRNDVGSTKEDLGTIMLTILRTVIQTVIRMDREDPLTANCVAVMTAMLRQMTEFHYQQYIKHFTIQIDLTDFLMEILMVFKDLVSINVYPSDWNEMILLQNSVFLKALRFFAKTIKERFLNPLEYEVWNNFFHCAISFLTQDALQLERFSPAKRAKVISRYKDMRRETGFEIRAMWFNLGQHKVKFIPQIIGPFLEMTLVPEIELRKATIPIFFDMMQCEYLGGHSGRTNGNFNQVEGEVISQLDALVEGGRGDEQYKELFCDILSELCGSHKTMHEQGLAFVETVRVLMERLLEYRDVIHDESKDNRMSCLVNLLSFYETNRREMYIRYLQKLCDLHLECDNFTEAAHTLMLYANELEWSNEILPSLVQSDRHTDALTHRELKEILYSEIIGYFNRGKMWEKGIEMCKELAQQYEQEILDYDKMSSILKKQAQFYDNIMKQMRPEPEYFRVGYYGMGFPSFLQGKVFIYRGQEYERLSDFTARLQNQYPNAQLMKTLNPPGDDIINSQKQYLQINAVTPIMNLPERFRDKSVHEQILKYYKVNEVEKFTFSKRLEEGGSDVTTMWLERTNLTTQQPLPGILRWFPVISSHTFRVSPLETAIETMEATNEKIRTRIQHAKQDPTQGIKQLGMVLNGVVDAAVQGGISNYKTFFSEEYKNRHKNQMDIQLVENLKTAAVRQLQLLDEGLVLHGEGAPENMKPFHAHMEHRFSQMEKFLEQDCGVKLSDYAMEYDSDYIYGMPESVRRRLLSSTQSVKRIQTMPPQSSRSSDIPRGAPGITSQHSAPNLQSKHQSVMVKSPQENSTPLRRDSATGNRPVVYRKDTEAKSISRILNFGGAGSRSSIASSEGSDSSEGSSKRGNSVIIELKEELTSARPPRPEGRKSRPPSTHLTQFAENHTNNVGDNGAQSPTGPPPPKPAVTPNVLRTPSRSEAPPPLPVKTTSDPKSSDIRKSRSGMSPRRVSGGEIIGGLTFSLPPADKNGSSPQLPPKKATKSQSTESDA